MSHSFITRVLTCSHCLLGYMSFLLLSTPSLSATVTTKPVAIGVTLTEEIDQNPPEIIHVLTVDLNNPLVHLEPIPGQDTITGPTGDVHEGRQEVRLTATRHGAVAAVNGDYFPFTGDPYGAAVWNGNLYSEPYPGRCVMGIEPDGRTVMFDTIGFLGELQTSQNQLTAITGVDRMVSATDTNDLVVFTPTFGPIAGIRPDCMEVVMTGVNLPLRPSELEVGTVTAVNVSSSVGSSIPSDGVVLAALPGGQASAFLTSNLHVGDRAEFVCSIAPQPALKDAVSLAMVPRDANDLPSRSGLDMDPTAYSWATVQEVIGGGPHLVIDGQVSVDAEEEGFTDAFSDNPNPRTGVGIRGDGKMIIVTVDGRQSLSRGVSLSDFASILKRYGAENAMNLDGGGSTTMVANGLLVSSIAYTGGERRVANALCVFAPPLYPLATAPPTIVAATSSDATLSPSPAVPEPTAATESPVAPMPTQAPPPIATPVLPTISIVGIPTTMSVGDTAQLSAVARSSPVAGSDPHLLWEGSVDAGIAFIDQTGLLTALQEGQGTVNALYRGQLVQQSITIVSGPLASAQTLISASDAAPNPERPLETVLIIGVHDNRGDAVARAAIHLDVAQGTADVTDLQTDVDGSAQANIVWKKKSGGTVMISSNGLVSKSVTQPIR
jgi:hypothetical protein